MLKNAMTEDFRKEEGRQPVRSANILQGGRAKAALLILAAAFTAFPFPNTAFSQPYAPPNGPRERVVIVNDIGGDPDGLLATIHAFMSPSAEVRALVASRGGAGGVAGAVAKGNEINTLMGTHVKVLSGSDDRLTSRTIPIPSEGSRAIVAEANRTDKDLKPLFITVGGGLTDVASALLQDPSIADKFTLVWIGGAEYPAGGKETNFNIDPIAAQIVFNDFKVPIWQVPRDVYFQTQVSLSELQYRMAPHGSIGKWMYDQFVTWRIPKGESWTLGDSPLVELTALTAWFSNTNTSASYDVRPAPTLGDDGTYVPNPSGRPIRVYKNTMVRYFMEDFFAKLALRYPNK